MEDDEPGYPLTRLSLRGSPTQTSINPRSVNRMTSVAIPLPPFVLFPSWDILLMPSRCLLLIVGVTQISDLYTVLFSLSLPRRDGGGGRGGGWESMAQLTSVRLRVRADNSIDRRCSIDTAYPFQPHRGQADLYTGTRGWLGSRWVTRAVANARGNERGGCGTGGGGDGSRWRCSTLAAALTLRSLTFPNEPR